MKRSTRRFTVDKMTTANLVTSGRNHINLTNNPNIINHKLPTIKIHISKLIHISKTHISNHLIKIKVHKINKAILVWMIFMAAKSQSRCFSLKFKA